MTNEKQTSIYDRDRVSSIAPTIYSQLPEWVNTSFENFSEFLNHYYKFVASETEVDLVLDNLSSLKAAGKTDESLIDVLYGEFANYIPSGHPDDENAPSRRELLLKIVSTLYNSRGTSESAKKFFSFFYNDHNATVTPFKTEDFSINVFNDTDLENRPKSKLWEPYTYVIRTSADIDEWYDPYIKIIHPIGYYLLSLITHEVIAGQSDELGDLSQYPNQLNNPLNWRKLPELNYSFYWDYYKWSHDQGISFNYATLRATPTPIRYNKANEYGVLEDDPFYTQSENLLKFGDDYLNYGDNTISVGGEPLTFGGDALNYGNTKIGILSNDEDRNNPIWLASINPTYGADHCPTVQPGLLKRTKVSGEVGLNIEVLANPVIEGEWGAFVITIDNYYLVDETPHEVSVKYSVVEVTSGALVQNSWLDDTIWDSDLVWNESAQPERAINNPALDVNEISYDQNFVLAQGFWDDDHESAVNVWNDDAVISFDGFEYAESENLDRYDIALPPEESTIPNTRKSTFDGDIPAAVQAFNDWDGVDPATLPDGIFAFPTFVNQSSYNNKTFTVKADSTLSTSDGFVFKNTAFKTFTINNITSFPPIPSEVEVFKTNALQ